MPDIVSPFERPLTHKSFFNIVYFSLISLRISSNILLTSSASISNKKKKKRRCREDHDGRKRKGINISESKNERNALEHLDKLEEDEKGRVERSVSPGRIGTAGSEGGSDYSDYQSGRIERWHASTTPLGGLQQEEHEEEEEELGREREGREREGREREEERETERPPVFGRDVLLRSGLQGLGSSSSQHHRNGAAAQRRISTNKRDVEEIKKNERKKERKKEKEKEKKKNIEFKKREKKMKKKKMEKKKKKHSFMTIEKYHTSLYRVYQKHVDLLQNEAGFINFCRIHGIITGYLPQRTVTTLYRTM